jgi:carboxyl-terminal processing protease
MMNKNLPVIIIFSVVFTGCEKLLLGPGPENTPAGNFDVLWRTIDEKYGQFPVKNVNWDSLYNVYSKQITPSTSEHELWNISSQILAPLNDAHIALFNRDYTTVYTPWNIDFERSRGFDLGLIKNKFLSNSAVTGEGIITWGTIRNTSIGYIHLSTFGPAANGRNWVIDIDNVINEMSGSEGIILDVRNNGGGFLVNTLYVASAFISNELTYFYSRLKTGPGHNEFGEPVAKKVFPRDTGPLYSGDIVLLTNRFSSSGSEVLAQILKYVPASVQIGDTTTGVVGEVTHVAQLPNGWTLNYPCTLTTTPDGKCPEGIGIIPDIAIENTKADILAGNDRVLESAINHLLK